MHTDTDQWAVRTPLTGRCPPPTHLARFFPPRRKPRVSNSPFCRRSYWGSRLLGPWRSRFPGLWSLRPFSRFPAEENTQAELILRQISSGTSQYERQEGKDRSSTDGGRIISKPHGQSLASKPTAVSYAAPCIRQGEAFRSPDNQTQSNERKSELLGSVVGIMAKWVPRIS